MANGKKTTEVATTATSTTEAIGPVNEQAAALAALQAAGIDLGDTAGKENIDRTDLLLPFLAIAQKMSPQVDKSVPDKYIKGLEIGDLFNSITKKIYGPGPLTFIPIALKKHAIEFIPFKDGGGIKDRDVPWDDDRCKFDQEDAPDGKPVATKFYDWAVLLVENMELIVISFKVTNFKTGKLLTTLINGLRVPCYASLFSIGTASKTNEFGNFGVFTVNGAGIATAEQAVYARKVYESMKGKDINIDHEGDIDPTQAADAKPAGGKKGKDDIPF